MPQYRTVAAFLETANPTAPEQALIAACRAGRICKLGDGTRPEAPDPTRTIRADLLRLLITGGSAECGLPDDGLWLEGAWITGALNLRFAKARGRTALVACHFTDQPDLTQARLQQLGFNGSHLPGLFAQGIVVKGSVFLRNLHANGTVDVAGAQIGGQLDCDGAELDGKDGPALNAQGVTTGASLFLRNLRATGTVDVAGAQVGGQLACDGALLYGKDGRALNAQGVTTTQSLFLRNLSAMGTVNVADAQIGGQLSCDGASFGSHPLFDCSPSLAFDAKKATVAGRLFWRKIRVNEGFVDFSDASVTELVIDADSWPANSTWLTRRNFHSTKNGLSLADARARIADLQNDLSSTSEFYPLPYTLLAKELFEVGLDKEARETLENRERLLAMETRKALRMEIFSTSWLSPWAIIHCSVLLWRNFQDLLLRYGIGYGYRPFNSVIALAVLFLFATVLAHFTWTEGSFAPNSDVIITSPGWIALVTMDCAPRPYGPCLPNPAESWSSFGQDGLDWDSFNRYGYAADLVIPILDLGQTDAWAPSKDRGPWGWWLWWLRWLLSGAGWIVTGLGAAAVTGIIKRDRG